MLLNVSERIGLLGLLPSEGTVLTLRIVRDLQRELSFSEEELTALKFVSEDNMVRWENEAEVDKEVEIGDNTRDVVIDIFNKMDVEGKFPMHLLGLFDKFDDASS